MRVGHGAGFQSSWMLAAGGMICFRIGTRSSLPPSARSRMPLSYPSSSGIRCVYPFWNAWYTLDRIPLERLHSNKCVHLGEPTV